MDGSKPIAIRQVQVAGRTIAVELYRNRGGGVAARCLLGGRDMPIIDGDDEESVLAAVEDVLETLLFARGRRPVKRRDGA